MITAAVLLLACTLALQDDPRAPSTRELTELPTLVANSDVIVHAVITDSHDFTPRDGGVHYEFTVSESLVGPLAPGQSVWFQSGGGWGTQRANYWQGERVLLFLKSRSDNAEPTMSNPLYRQLTPYVYLEQRQGLQLFEIPDLAATLGTEIEKR